MNDSQFIHHLQQVSQQQGNQLQAQFHPLQFSYHWFETLPSTNRALWEMLDQGAPAGTVVWAQQQTAGRGQWGRLWQSATGGLYLSLGVMPNVPVTQGPQLTLCSAWGIAIALRSYGIPTVLKWPNDLVLSGRKLGGILIETRVQQSSITHAVIGVGINWKNPVPETGTTLQAFLSSPLQQGSAGSATLLKLVLDPFGLEWLAAVTLWGLASGYQTWHQHGVEPILMGYQALLTNIGQVIQLEERSALVLGVTAAGSLKVRLITTAADTLPQAQEILLPPGAVRLGYGL